MSNERETIQEVIDRLQGTCMETFDSELYTDDELREFDEQIFLCDMCGWYCETSEQHNHNGERVCQDCYEYDVPDEEKED